VNIQPSDGDSTKALYADWSRNYEEDIRSMGYDMPEQVALVLVEHGIFPPTKNTGVVILDAGCGDGLSGMALREAMKGNDSSDCRLVGGDVTPGMSEIAKTRHCYDSLVEMNLNKKLDPIEWQDNSIDMVSCVGTMTYVEPNGPCLDEFVRIVKPGGYIVYTNRTDRLKDFRAKETELRDDGKWKLLEAKGPLPYLPGNPDYGTTVEVKIFLYQVLKNEDSPHRSETASQATAVTTSRSGAKRQASSWIGLCLTFVSNLKTSSMTHSLTGKKASFSTSASSPDIKIVEVGPRDGLQNEKEPITVEQKLHLIHQLNDAGVTNLEVGSFVSPKWVPQMADSDKVLQGLAEDGRNRGNHCHYSVLVPNRKGLEAALQQSDMIDEIAIFAAASEEFSQRNINSTIDESMERFRGVVDDLNEFNMSVAGTRNPIRVRGYVSTVVACPYQGMIKPKQVVKVVEKLLDLGCYEISLGDTIGAGTPGTIKVMLNEVLQTVSPKQLAMHCHDTYGQALANILVGLERDVFIIDSSVAGLGGCPYAKGASGNVATEDVVYMLHGMGMSTGVDLDMLVDAGDYICRVLNRETGSKAAKAIKAKRRRVTYSSWKTNL
jgi:hydroxymethylglutaryl-CoA lyase